jgi:hypothetical protein
MPNRDFSQYWVTVGGVRRVRQAIAEQPVAGTRSLVAVSPFVTTGKHFVHFDLAGTTRRLPTTRWPRARRTRHVARAAVRVAFFRMPTMLRESFGE